MTRHTHHHAAALPAPHLTALAWFNLALIALAVACLLSYVIAANSLAADAWRFSDAQDELDVLLETRNGLIAQQAALEDRAVLTALAADAGMVDAGSVVYLIQDQPVAAR